MANPNGEANGSKIIYCDSCSGIIKNRDDLVTTTMFLEVIPYHKECFADELKGLKTIVLNNSPINGHSGNVGVAVTTLIGIGWLLIAEGNFKYLSLIALIPIIYRLYSYLTYERYLD